MGANATDNVVVGTGLATWRVPTERCSCTTIGDDVPDGKAIELRHQRNSDVTLDVVETTKSG